MNSPIKFGLFICLLAILLNPSPTVAAAEGPSLDIPLQTLNGNQVINLVGLISTQAVNIPIPDNWIITDDSWIEIDITASELLDLDKASLTISLNGLQVTSLRLTDVTGTTQRIKLSTKMFKGGENALAFAGMLYLPDDSSTDCRGWDDASRWVLIGPQSKLHLSYQKQDLPTDLSRFPEAYVRPLERYLPDGGGQAVIVLPDDIQQDDLNALAAISYFLGHAAGDEYTWHPQILRESEFVSLQDVSHDLIYINNIPLQLKNDITTDKDAVAMFPSPWDQSKTLMVIADQNRQDSYTPALVFGDPMRKVLLRGNVAYVSKSNPPAPPVLQNQYSFEELGYLDRTVRGIGKGDLIYRIFIPYNVDPTTATLFLQLSHAPDLDPQTSSFSVYLNGFTVASILPTARNARLDPIQVDMPLNRFRAGINFIRISFDLHLPFSSCERAPESVWVTIFRNSIIEMTYRNRITIPSLKDFPLPFNDYPGFTFVIPNENDPPILKRVAQLAFSIGESSHFVNLPPELIPASKFAESKPNRPNLILVGLPTENSVIMEINDFLPQPFTDDGKELQQGFGVFLPTYDKNASTGLLQIIPSPWTNDGTVLVLTGTDATGANWTWDAILDPGLRGQFSGNIMVVGSENRIVSSPTDKSQSLNVQFQQTADVSNIPIIGQLLQKSERSGTIASSIAVVVAAIGVLLALKLFANRGKPGI
jgi:hypothetical protein